jgi:hypothetical protein
MTNSCCTEITDEYVEIIGFNAETFENLDRLNSPLLSGDTTITDTLIIQAEFDINFIASKQYFTNSLYATTCPEWGEYGLKNKIREISFTSSETFQDRTPNSSLNEFMTCNYYTIRKDITLDSLKSVLNNWNPGFLNKCTFFINYKPDNSLPQEFKITFELDNDEIIVLKTNEIVWI